MTNPKNNTSNPGRRSFLLKAATVAAGSAALTVAASAGSSVLAYQNGPDPILAAIEAHRTARVVVYSAADAVTAREKQLAEDGKRNHRDREGDAQLEECEAALDRVFEAEAEAACILVSERPTTMAGVMALLQYTIAADTDGEGWPSGLLSDDGTKTRSWHYFLIENLAETLAEMALRGRLA